VSAVHALRLTGVSKSFSLPGFRDQRSQSVTVLKDVDLVLAPGEKASLIGPSGTGKSTLFALIAGLLRPDSGIVEIGGVSLSDMSEQRRATVRARTIGLVLQSDNLIPFLNARENVELAVGIGRRDAGREPRTSARDLLDKFGVGHRAEHLPRQLSGGEAQRVALAVAIANQPAVLLADEVVGQLDSDTARAVLDEVLGADIAVLYITHDLALADRVSTRYQLVENQVRSR